MLRSTRKALPLHRAGADRNNASRQKRRRPQFHPSLDAGPGHAVPHGVAGHGGGRLCLEAGAARGRGLAARRRLENQGVHAHRVAASDANHLGRVHDDDGGVVELNGPAIGVLADLEDVQGAVVVDADPDEGEDGEAGPEDCQADGNEFLVGLDLHVLAEEHADDESGDATAHVRGMGGTLVLRDGDVDNVQGHQEKEQGDRRKAELLLAPVHDEVGEVDADEGVAAARATHDGGVRVGEVVAHRAAEDPDVVHDGQTPPTMNALERDAHHDVQQHVHGDMRDADVRELVGEPAPDLGTEVLAVGVGPAKVEHLVAERVHATLGFEEARVLLA
mmetsp:Transcript_127712/g.408298  ORF Transcript_127712/g.408298 Transcript_127712/m.408298 type:complete len:333 (+) Transcript_127712:192-1190(+)